MSERPPREVHVFEQTGAMMIDMARVLGAYYRALIDGGIPPALASKLVLRCEQRMIGERQTRGPGSDSG